MDYYGLYNGNQSSDKVETSMPGRLGYPVSKTIWKENDHEQVS